MVRVDHISYFGGIILFGKYGIQRSLITDNVL